MIPRRTFVIAEAGVNHDGSVDDALRLIDAAADAGADCIKFQTFRADALASPRAEKAEYQKSTSDPAESQRNMLRRLELPREAYPCLMERAQERGIAFLSTPFDPGSFDFLVRNLGLRRIKIGSGDLTNAPLLLQVALAGCDIVLSTGMANLGEIEEALSVLAFGYAGKDCAPGQAAFATAWADPRSRTVLTERVVLLHCTTEYPAPAESVNLRAMDTLVSAFGLPVGFSDHTQGIAIAAAAVARGAMLVEKHLTLDRGRSGPDHAASLDPAGFRQLVETIRSVESALGTGCKVADVVEIKNMAVARKSLVAACPIAAGGTFSTENLAVKRPGSGLPPTRYWDLVGRVSPKAYQTDDLIEL